MTIQATPAKPVHLSKQAKSIVAMFNDDLTLADYKEIGRICVEKAMEAEKEARDELADKIKELAAKAGIDPSAMNVAALFGKPKGEKSESNVPIKYQNPANPNETWTGRGRMPKWLAHALATSEGTAKVSDFLIEKQVA